MKNKALKLLACADKAVSAGARSAKEVAAFMRAAKPTKTFNKSYAHAAARLALDPDKYTLERRMLLKENPDNIYDVMKPISAMRAAVGKSYARRYKEVTMQRYPEWLDLSEVEVYMVKKGIFKGDGVLYCASPANNKNVIKLGYTSRSAETRISEAGAFSLTAWKLNFQISGVSHLVETKIHNVLKEQKLWIENIPSKESFSCTAEHTLSVIKSMIELSEL